MSTLFSHFFQKINQISPLEHDFTEVLEAIALKPKTLYFRGKMPENVSKMPISTSSKSPQNQPNPAPKSRSERPKTVAIVGSRHNTRYGQEVAYKLAYELGRRGVVVVSGLAYGIDTIAHRGCLAAHGTTVAVLGTRIDHIYPSGHLKVAKEIVQTGGAIISEYAPKDMKDAPLAPGEGVRYGAEWVSFEKLASADPAQSTLFPARPYDERRLEPRISFLWRNRLISGLSDIVVVVEAAEKSGSLNTATHALEQGKTVFAVPGNITSPYSQGCNKLIRQGALPYTEPDDVLRELFPEEYAKKHQNLRQQKLIGSTDVETKILQAVASGLRSGEDIMQKTHLPPEVFNQTVTLLEIKGRLRPLGMNNWGLA